MLSLSLLFWFTLMAAIAGFWWQSDKVKSLALARVTQHCRSQDLQLLDQTMVLKGLWPTRNEAGGLRLRRRYSFEFTSTGEVRNRGSVILVGNILTSLELEPHILPGQAEQIH